MWGTKQFADDTERGCGFSSGIKSLAEGSRLEQGAMINGMKFNKPKAGFFTHGRVTSDEKYKLGEGWLKSSSAERDLAGQKTTSWSASNTI